MSLSNAQKRNILASIEKKHGTLRAEDLVEEARNPKHPLHDRFEWDDSKAAHRYRVEQARGMISSVYQEFRRGEFRYTVPYYVRDPRLPSHEQGYVSVPRVRTKKELAAAAIRAEFERARAAMRRARELAMVLGFEENVDGLLENLDRLSGELAPLVM